ncbi:MAG: DUF748 domain-containing protein [Betaproteobacteria bacterium]
MTALLAYRRLLLAGAAVVAVILAVLTFAVHDAKARILQALGPRATVGDISLSYPKVTLRDVRIAADPARGAWPAPEEFHAARVEVSIAVGSLWAFRHGEPLVVSDVQVADGTLVMLRTRGRVTMLPALRDTSKAKAAAMNAAPSVPATAARAAAERSDEPREPAPATTAFIIEHIRFDRMAVDFYDATLGEGAPRHLHFEPVQGSVDAVALPTLDRPIAVALAGTLKGVEHDGAVAVDGSFTPAAHDANLALRMTDVDMIALAPYLLRLGERTVKHGRLDLVLDARVVDRQVHAPGRLTFTGLEFGEGGGGTFAGVERRAVLAALARDGRIELKFTLDGRTDDPKFSLDERLGVRIAAGLGEAVGVSVKGVVEGVGSVLKGLLGGGGDKPAR